MEKDFKVEYDFKDNYESYLGLKEFEKNEKLLDGLSRNTTKCCASGTCD